MKMILSNILPFILFIPLSQSLQCFDPAKDSLPAPAHCQHLSNVLAYAARIPSKNIRKDWGRGLPSSAFTGKLPKLFWLAGRPIPSTCGINVDVDPVNPLAVEKFDLMAVAVAAEKILRICLYGRSQVGSEPLGLTKHVLATMTRINPPGLLDQMEGRLEIIRFKNGVKLFAMSVNATKPTIHRVFNNSHSSSAFVDIS